MLLNFLVGMPSARFLMWLVIIDGCSSWPIFKHMGVSWNGGTQQLLVFLLKMTILGCFGGTTILENTHMGPNLT